MNWTLTFCDRRLATNRATTSTADPAAKGLMRRTGRDGHSWAMAGATPKPAPKSSVSAVRLNRNKLAFIRIPSMTQ
jgi:hypothetical protein